VKLAAVGEPSKEHDRHLWSRRLIGASRAGVAVGTALTAAILTIVAPQSLTYAPQRIEQRDQKPPALGQPVFDVWRAAIELAPFDERGLFHFAQPFDERSTADRVKRC
jgi:hypothetical protein